VKDFVIFLLLLIPALSILIINLLKFLFNFSRKTQKFIFTERSATNLY